MNTITATTTEQHDGYTLSECGTITLGKTTYTVKIQEIEETGSTIVWLHGPRGGAYFLREFLGQDNGVRQVISANSGAPLRVRGNEVRVIMIGNIIEVAE